MTSMGAMLTMVSAEVSRGEGTHGVGGDGDFVSMVNGGCSGQAKG